MSYCNEITIAYIQNKNKYDFNNNCLIKIIVMTMNTVLIMIMAFQHK